jgi:hypothetical protein
LDDNSDIEMIWDTSRFEFRYCNTVLEKDNLKLSFQAAADSVGEYTIEVNGFNGKFISEIYQSYAVLDCSYVTARFRVLEDKFEIDKQTYQKGDSVSGALSLLALGREAYLKESGDDTLRQNFDTIRVVGKFRSRLQ